MDLSPLTRIKIPFIYIFFFFHRPSNINLHKPNPLISHGVFYHFLVVFIYPPYIFGHLAFDFPICLNTLVFFVSVHLAITFIAYIIYKPTYFHLFRIDFPKDKTSSNPHIIFHWLKEYIYYKLLKLTSHA